MTDKIQHIEVLRGLSIILVFLFHLDISLFQYGYLGVDIFFVISGYLMAFLYGDLQSRDEIKGFWLRRFLRILPAYYIVILLTLVVCVVLTLNHEVNQVYEQIIWSSFFLSNIGYWLQSDYFSDLYFQPLLNLWSLGVEIQYYLIFPFLLMLERYSKFILFALFIGSFSLYVMLSVLENSAAFYLMPARLWAFLVGFYIARYPFAFLAGKAYVGRAALFILVASLFAVAVLNNQYAMIKQNMLLNVVTVLLTAVMIKSGLGLSNKTSLLTQGFCLLGKYSYSVYLVHFPVIALFNYQPFQPTQLSVGHWSDYIAIVLITAGLSIVLHELIEKRARKVLNARSILLMACLFAVLVFSLQKPVYQLTRVFLEPEAFNASHALVGTMRERCTRLQFMLAYNQNSCQLQSSNEQSNNTLLVGDSHMDAIKESVQAQLQDQDINLFRFKERATLYPNGSRRHLERLLSDIRQLKIKHVIIHQTESLCMTCLERILNELEALGARVYVIAPVPVFSENLPHFFYRQIGQENKRMAVDTTRNSYMEKRRGGLAAIKALQQQHQHLQLFEMHDLFCKDQCAMANAAGELYYYDNNHLTPAGVEVLKPVLRDIAETIKAGR